MALFNTLASQLRFLPGPKAQSHTCTLLHRNMIATLMQAKRLPDRLHNASFWKRKTLAEDGYVSSNNDHLHRFLYKLAYHTKPCECCRSVLCTRTVPVTSLFAPKHISSCEYVAPWELQQARAGILHISQMAESRVVFWKRSVCCHLLCVLRTLHEHHPNQQWQWLLALDYGGRPCVHCYFPSH